MKQKKTAICIDQQGGKGNANYQIEVACTILSDSHGTPHGVCIVYGAEDTNRKEILPLGRG